MSTIHHSTPRVPPRTHALAQEVAPPQTQGTRTLWERFGPQRTGTADMPNPGAVARQLALRAIEVLDGHRSLEQLSSWLSEQVADQMKLRRTIRQHRRVAYNDQRTSPLVLGGHRLSHPKDGIVEAVVIVHSRERSRAVTIRLESLDHRWRATELTVL